MMAYVDEFGRHRQLHASDDERRSMNSRRRRDSESNNTGDRFERRLRYLPNRRSRSPSPASHAPHTSHDASSSGHSHHHHPAPHDLRSRLGLPARRTTMPGVDYRDHRDRPDPQARRTSVDPLTLDYLVDWKYFANYLREKGIIGERPTSKEDDEKQCSEITEKYDAFKAQWQQLQLRKFFDVHCKEDWMLEKYFPDHQANRRAMITATKLSLFEAFKEALHQGHYGTVSLDLVPGEEITEPEWEAQLRLDLIKRTLYMKSVPLSVQRRDIEAMVSAFPGFKYLTLTEPRILANHPEAHGPSAPQHANHATGSNASSHHDAAYVMALGPRVGWCVFESAAEAESALQELWNMREAREPPIIGQLTFSIQSAGTPKFRTTVSEAFSHPNRLQVDLDTVQTIAQQLDAEVGVNGAALIQALGLEQPKALLDALVLYLRRVHLYCYYSGGVEAESAEEMAWKCGDKMLRKAWTSESLETLDRHASFLAKFDAKVKQRFEMVGPEEIAKMGGVLPDNAANQFLNKFVIKEAENRFRCDVEKCSKMFMDTVFVIKHIKNKHADLANEANQLKTKAEYFNAFLVDPHHLAPREPKPPVAQPTLHPTPVKPLRLMNQRLGPSVRYSFREPMARDHRDFPMETRSFDPRGLKSYVDLDAPAEGEVTLDYD